MHFGKKIKKIECMQGHEEGGGCLTGACADACLQRVAGGGEVLVLEACDEYGWSVERTEGVRKFEHDGVSYVRESCGGSVGGWRRTVSNAD